jgi:hypothetical protein
VSDIEMLVVTDTQRSLDECLAFASAAGLTGVDTWGDPSTPSCRVSGFLDDVPIETIWWWRDYAEQQVAAPTQAVGDALVHGVSLKTSGLLATWKERLASVPDDIALARIEEAARRWGGYTPAALLTVARPGETLARLEWMVDASTRVLSIVYALNRVWQPTAKRLRDRTATLQVKPEGLGERIDAALTEHDPRTALRILTQVQLDTVQLAPGGPSVDRARTWLTAALELLA